MIEINSDILNAIEVPKSLNMTARIYIQPSIVFMDEFDSSLPPAFADEIGISNDPIPQEIAYISSGSTMASFFTHEGSLKYMLDDADAVTTISSISCVGKIGVYGDSLFLVNSSNQLVKYTVSWSDILSRSLTPLSGGATIATLPASEGYSACAVSETEVVAFYYDDGGIKTVYYSGTTDYEQPNRFMFPVYTEHERLDRSIQGMVTFTTAVKLNDDIFAYISNPLTGHVEGIKFSGNTKMWSDIYIAVPTDLDITQYETRIANSYVRDGVIYISCQLHQIELVEDETVISFIISSRDGKGFAYNRYTSVSNLGYRFLACINNNTIMISSCNRIASGSATYIFSPISGSDLYTEDITEKLVSITACSQESANMDFSDSDYSITNHPWIKEGNRLILQIGYRTPTGFQYVDYAKYIIDSKSSKSTPSGRSCSLSLVNESLFNLSSLSSPYYTEVISKSSLYSDFSEMGDFSSSGSGGISEAGFAVDFWKCFGSSEYGATEAVVETKNGLEYFEYEGSHKVGIKTEKLKQALNSSDYPLITDDEVTIKFYGWSFDDRSSGNSNDIVSIGMICSGSDGDYTSGSAGGVHFPNTYPSTASGNYPIEVNIPSVIGDKIKEIVIVFEAANDTIFYPSRVEVTAGATVTYSRLTNSTWTYEEDEKRYKLPTKRKAYVMFAQRPFNAFNFIASAGFEHTITGNLASYSVAMGISGLALDNGNYICGRYDFSTNKMEIIKVRQSIVTVLVSETPTVTVPETFELQFEHRDGHFVVRLKINDEWIDQASYDWSLADGVMVLDHINATSCGIYGIADTPFFRTTGYMPDASESEDEAGVSSIGFPVAPGFNTYSGFPSSGEIKVEDVIYKYNTKMSQTEIRGPFQFRQCGDGTGGHYIEPFGDNTPGLECRDMDWTRSDTADVGRICAVDDGVSFEIESTKWDVWITTGGAVVELPGRARYSDGMAAAIRHSLTNRVYVTYALTGLSSEEGSMDWISHGTEVAFHYEGEIYCTYFNGSSGNEDATVKDIINSISKASGAIAEFEDIEYETFSISGSSSIGIQEYVSGFDLTFSVDKSELSNNDYIEVIPEAGFVEEIHSCSLRLIRDTSNNRFKVEFYNDYNVLVERFFFSVPDEAFTFRVLFHDNFVTVYINNVWVYTFGAVEIFYDHTCNILFNSNASITVNNVLVSELGDWSEAFYIDLDTNGRSAISQIIRERPVEIISRSNGSIKYSYNEVRDNLELVDDFISSYSESSSMPNNCASNAIVYADIVRTLQYNPYLERYGFATRVFRLSTLSIGSLKAAKLLLQRNLESADKYNLSYRPDPRLEVGDEISINVSVYGSGTSIVRTNVIEKIGISLRDGKYSMNISGRKSL